MSSSSGSSSHSSGPRSRSRSPNRAHVNINRHTRRAVLMTSACHPNASAWTRQGKVQADAIALSRAKELAMNPLSFDNIIQRVLALETRTKHLEDQKRSGTVRLAALHRHKSAQWVSPPKKPKKSLLSRAPASGR